MAGNERERRQRNNNRPSQQTWWHNMESGRQKQHMLTAWGSSQPPSLGHSTNLSLAQLWPLCTYAQTHPMNAPASKCLQVGGNAHGFPLSCALREFWRTNKLRIAFRGSPRFSLGGSMQGKEMYKLTTLSPNHKGQHQTKYRWLSGCPKYIYFYHCLPFITVSLTHVGK